MSGQTVQTQIRLLLKEQSDQGLHCLLFHLHVFGKYFQVWPLCLNLRYITAKFSGVRKFRNFTVVTIFMLIRLLDQVCIVLAAQASLCIVWSRTMKTFSCDRAHT